VFFSGRPEAKKLLSLAALCILGWHKIQIRVRSLLCFHTQAANQSESDAGKISASAFVFCVLWFISRESWSLCNGKAPFFFLTLPATDIVVCLWPHEMMQFFNYNQNYTLKNGKPHRIYDSPLPWLCNYTYPKCTRASSSWKDFRIRTHTRLYLSNFLLLIKTKPCPNQKRARCFFSRLLFYSAARPDANICWSFLLLH
jgi:hypothetical protein